MKNHVLVGLFVAVVLALPAFAQQTGSTSQNQPAASQPTQTAPAAPASSDQAASSAQTTSSQTVGATGKQPLQAETHEGFWGKMNPFARKKYVQRQTQPIRDRVNELDELTADNTKAIKDTRRPRPARHPTRLSQGERSRPARLSTPATKRKRLSRQQLRPTPVSLTWNR